MNKTELVEQLVQVTGIDKKKASEVLNATLEAITGALAEGDKVTLPGFGVFSVSERAERQGKNPQTGEALTIKAATLAKFKAGKSLKDRTNGDV